MILSYISHIVSPEWASDLRQGFQPLFYKRCVTGTPEVGRFCHIHIAEKTIFVATIEKMSFS